MTITEIRTNKKFGVVVSPVNLEDLKQLTIKRYYFSWKKISLVARLYKLCIKGKEEILGVIAVVDIPEEMRIEIKLLSCSKENVGHDKIYDNIAGCLVAYTCREAVKKYGDKACVSLLPKTILKRHYKEKYKMVEAGQQLYLEGESLISLIYQYIL
jgi:hypothetical protein